MRVVLVVEAPAPHLSAPSGQHRSTPMINAPTSAGKTTLLHRLVDGRYRPGLPPTYGAEFGAKRVGNLCGRFSGSATLVAVCANQLRSLASPP